MHHAIQRRQKVVLSQDDLVVLRPPPFRHLSRQLGFIQVGSVREAQAVGARTRAGRRAGKDAHRRRRIDAAGK
jgi:hypothetical protein